MEPMRHTLRCVFMGTPEIALASLHAMIDADYRPVAVVTTPDRPAGRGLTLQASEVKKFVAQTDIPLLQPLHLSDPEFLDELTRLQPDLIVVVAFRKLPQAVLDIPRIGAFNLHASLLPDYRGAAPIQWAVINGEKKTGVTTFMLDKNIDTGKILRQQSVDIGETQTAGDVHDMLMEVGAKLVVQTIRDIESGDYQLVDQTELPLAPSTLHKAPKIFKEDCRIDWSKGVKEVYDFIRGLSPYPGAFTEFVSPDAKCYIVKVLTSSYEFAPISPKRGMLETDATSYLRVACRDGYINFRQIQLAGKKIMNVDEFLRGFRMSDAWQLKKA